MSRSKIRIRDGRAKPIDLLAKYISAEDDDLAVEMHEPYTFLNGLTVTDMDDLLEDIKVSISLHGEIKCLISMLKAPAVLFFYSKSVSLTMVIRTGSTRPVLCRNNIDLE